MAKFGLSTKALADIGKGFVEVKQIIAKATQTSNLSGLVRDLRRIPTADRDKKRTLAEFFQTPEGERYSREDKKKAYDDVLGVERNRRQIG